jgi:hypothetical protein
MDNNPCKVIGNNDAIVRSRGLIPAASCLFPPVANIFHRLQKYQQLLAVWPSWPF